MNNNCRGRVTRSRGGERPRPDRKMNKYKVYLEVDKKGCCMAHIRELPGCFVWDRTQKKVLERVPEIIKVYLSFLKKNGEKNVSIPKKIEYEILETQKGTCPVISGSKAALFSYDLLPPAKAFINQCIRWMGHNRKELLKKVGKLSDEILDWKTREKCSLYQRDLESRRQLRYLVSFTVKRF